MTDRLGESIARLDKLGDGRARRDVPFARSYWIVPGMLLAGYYPGHHEHDMMVAECTSLTSSGIRSVVNLMESGETSGLAAVAYEDWIATVERFGAKCSREPIADMSVPDSTTMTRILDDVDLSMKEQMPVYIHCFGGRGRTGTVVGCWLMRHGFADANDVFDLIRGLREQMPDAKMDSPETEEQRMFVRRFAAT